MFKNNNNKIDEIIKNLLKTKKSKNIMSKRLIYINI